MLKMMLTPAPNFQDLTAFEGSGRIKDPMLGHENPDWQAAALTGRLAFLGSTSTKPALAPVQERETS
jgi:hypothetical protein